MKAWQRVALAMFAVGWGANQFTPMLLAYGAELGMGVQTRAFLFGVYAAGLVPALLVGGAASDRWGRRAVVLPAVVLSPLATLLLVLERESTAGLAAGRLLAGVCSGVVFSAASAWVSDLAVDEAPGTAARRAAIALSAGFGVGPLVTGLVAQWSPAILITPYLPHLVMGAVAVLLLLPAPGPAPRDPVRRALVRLPAVTRGRRFLLVVAPAAPWVFGCAALSIAFLPAELPQAGEGALALTGLLAGLTLGTGVLVQPWARRLEERRPLLAGEVGLAAGLLACLLGLGVLALGSRLLLLPLGPIFGVGYGCVLVSGLRETERLADPEERGATVAVFYALTYLGFAVPYVLGALGGGATALGVALAAMAVSLLVVTLGRRGGPPTPAAAAAAPQGR